jgi:hypothetical protein
LKKRDDCTIKTKAPAFSENSKNSRSKLRAFDQGNPRFSTTAKLLAATPRPSRSKLRGIGPIANKLTALTSQVANLRADRGKNSLAATVRGENRLGFLG